MLQLSIPSMEEDLLACALRREKSFIESIIRDLEGDALSHREADTRLKEIERGLKRLCSE